MNEKTESHKKIIDNSENISKIYNMKSLEKYNKSNIKYESNKNYTKLKEEEYLTYSEEEIEIIKIPLQEKIDFIILIFIGFIVLIHIIHFLLSEYVRYLFNYKKLQFSICLYLFSTITLIEIFFIIGYFIKTNYKIYDKKKEIRSNKLIVKLKKIVICLIFINSTIIRFNILSPVELKIFFEKNILIINEVYLILGLYVFGYIFLWGIGFFLKKKRFDSYIKMKKAY